MASSPSFSSSSGGFDATLVFDVSEEKTNGTRLARLLIDAGTDLLRRFLSSIHPPKTLENVLKKNKPKLQNLKSRRVIFDDQWEKLFPVTGVPADMETFDITLLHLLIREFSYLPSPVTGWHKMPNEDDESIQAHITRIKCFRNDMCHGVSTGVSNSDFEAKWNKISSSLEAIEIDVLRRKIQCLKNDPIDHDKRRTVEEQVERWQKLQQEESDYEYSSCLPDKVPVFGRSQEINKVKDHIQSGKVAVVLITGGPGFGKTTVAKETAHELAKPESGKTVLFCSLLAKGAFHEVATEMIHSCGKMPGQLPENPDQWLKEWSKQTQSPICFVLDNADGVLESKADRNLFLATLRAMRMLSRKNITFVITSRTTFRDPDLSVIEVTLSPLLPGEAKKVLISRVNREENQIEKLSKTDKLVELCGRVPLALSIVGSLLSDYPEDRLIERLEQEPMTVTLLESDAGESFHKAITNSFDLLTQAEQDALVVLSIFPGSFDYNAAEAVLKEYSDRGSLPFLTLRSLKRKSLVEQGPSHRYQLHPLIRTFAQKTGETKDPQLLRNGENLACEHFVSLLEENAQLYWSKDKCKASIDAFNEERHNFEHFLQVFAYRLEDQDQEIVDSCQNFLEDFPQKCMYLEKCTQPKFYIQFLERLLRSFKSDQQPVHSVELLCLLGHEKRKAGEKEEYDKCMKKADKLYSEKKTEFHSKAFSEVIYLNSKARYLSENGIPYKPMEVYLTALEICETKIPDHPERAATLMFAGRYAKRSKQNVEAEKKFRKALELFASLLGDHYMTAQCLKDIADFLFFVEQKKNRYSDEPLSFYKKAMEMMVKLAMADHKESILTLKNYAVCHRQNGNLKQAKDLLKRAESVAERELKADHPWKVLVKTEIALLHHEIAIQKEIEEEAKRGAEEEMEKSMKEGLEMHYRIVRKRSFDKLGNKYLIRGVLECYPEKFPETQYPLFTMPAAPRKSR